MTEGSRDGRDTDILRQLAQTVRTESSDGARLDSNLEDTPICRLTLERSVPCVFLTWRRYATSAQLRFIHEQVLQLLRREGLSKILGDASSLAVIHVDDQHWIREDWMPRAAEAGLKAAATMTPYTFFGKQSVDKVQSGEPAGLKLRTFDSLDEARGWLCGVD